MLGHLSIGVNDLALATRFYDAVLAPIGWVRVWTGDDGVGYGPAGGNGGHALARLAVCLAAVGQDIGGAVEACLPVRQEAVVDFALFGLQALHDGVVEATYTDDFDYYGYFHSGRCYRYVDATARFNAAESVTSQTNACARAPAAPHSRGRRRRNRQSGSW